MINNKTINSQEISSDDHLVHDGSEQNQEKLDHHDKEFQATTTTTTTTKGTSIPRLIIYFLIYSAIFWTLYFIYQYKNNQEFKQKFVKWYLATFHGKNKASTPNVPSEFKVDFTTYKLPYKSSGGSHAKDYFKFTQEELKHYNGKDSSLPLLLAIKGRVYDVSEGQSYYGIDGGYHFFAGRDGTRSFVTGCFDEEKEECTSVQSKYSDFTEEQMQSVEDWVKFYDDHEKYKFIGIVTDLKDQ